MPAGGGGRWFGSLPAGGIGVPAGGTNGLTVPSGEGAGAVIGGGLVSDGGGVIASPTWAKGATVMATKLAIHLENPSNMF